MDVIKTLRDLYQEKRSLDTAIAALEARLRLRAVPSARSRRGRKSMSAEEREQVSLRMSKYWEARRASMRTLQAKSHSSAGASAGKESSA